MNANWQANCPKCIASKFTCDDHYRPEVECRQCDGNGWLPPASRMGQVRECLTCNGEGWRPMTQDELDAAAERQAENAASEPSVTMDEMHRAAWDQKQGLRR